MINTLSSFKNSHFIGLMGQSNAAGFQDGGDINVYAPVLGQYIFNNVSKSWQQLRQNYNNGGTPIAYTGSVGIEMKLMQLLKDYYGSDQFMFKYSAGGTPLGPKNSGETADWVPGTNETLMYNGCVSNYRKAIENFPAQVPRMKVLIWIQGENDTDNDRANNYQRDFETFITALKNDWQLPNLKIIQTLLADTQTAYNGIGKQIVNNAKINYSINGNKFISTDGTDCSNGVHFTASGQADIAQRIFNELTTML